MIIISQDEKMLINFNNISGIVIRKNNEDNMWQLQCKSEGENKKIIGKYKTEERAKGVLQLLLNKYSYEGAEENLNNYIASKMIAHIMITDHSEFYMPKE